MNELEERLTELEIRFTHQQRLIDELNEVILDDNRRLAELQREVRILRQMLQRLEPESPHSPDE
ncbi:SlyX protein [Geothermobacter ehrlichii]|uniref:SlyX protein n=1 Tax=Geothermobacter ehrlichii TaxID=213224 RepID=A0A5D3WKQ9_9BACT|nr:SlyX family protein [Geothermobacter ehrlichii]TYO98982.1 SlyX protein [Geothermobacter ehrlichii]